MIITVMHAVPDRHEIARRATKTVLVVDDHEPLRHTTERMVKAAGFYTLTAARGADALRMASIAHAILLDIKLPDVSGIEVLKQFRSGGRTARTPVILTSAYFADEPHRQRALELGASAFLVVPLIASELVATLDQLLELT